MSGEADEYLMFAISEWTPDLELARWRDGTEITPQEWRDVMALRAFHFRTIRDRKKDKTPQRRAMRTLRSLLAPVQRDQLRRRGYLIVVAPSGNAYRLNPKVGLTEAVVKHGRNYFARWYFCLHDDHSDPAEIMPPADLTLAHLLMISADEGEFLATANARRVETSMWDGQYIRRMRAARVEREGR